MKHYPTGLDRYQNCPRQAWYYINKWRKRAKGATLLIGQIMHDCLVSYIKATTFATAAAFDPVQHFRTLWTEAQRKEEIEYTTTQDPDKIEATCVRLIEMFPEAWARMDLVPVIDIDGEPFLERELEARIAPDITVAARLDGLFMSKRTGHAGPLDIKVAAQPYDPVATQQSDQLSIQQLCCEANLDRVALERVDCVGFLELIRRNVPEKTGRGKGPEILPPSVVPARAPAQLQELKQKIVWIDEDLRRGRFPKTPRQSHNTPCVMCDYANHCVNGSTEGLIVPASNQLVLPAA